MDMLIVGSFFFFIFKILFLSLTGDKKVNVLATASIDKKVKLWAAPPLPS